MSAVHIHRNPQSIGAVSSVRSRYHRRPKEGRMMAVAPNERRSGAEWAVILDRIQAALARSLEESPEPEPSPPPAESAGGPSLQGLEACLAGLQASLQRAEQIAAETDALLRSEAEALRGGSESVKQVREKLANWMAPGV
jgi:hypothetical protein